MKRIFSILFAVVLAFSLFGPTPLATAANGTWTSVVPNAFESTEAPSNNGFPFSASPARYQQLYTASELGGSGIIDKIAFRLDGMVVSSFSNQPVDLEVRLSHVTYGPDDLAFTTIFTNNVGLDETLVLDSVVSLSGTTSESKPNPFDIILDVDNIFTYDGNGNLLMEIRIFSQQPVNGYTIFAFDATGNTVGDSVARLYAVGASATTGWRASIGLITKFTFTTLPSEIHVYPGDSIQAAVNSASPGDTIIVHAGEYHQSVVISTDDVTLNGGRVAILDGTGLGAANGIRLSAGVSGVTIEGFEIRNYRIGISGSSTTSNLIRGNEVYDNEWGISLYYTNDNVIIENEITGSGHQGILIAFAESPGNLIKRNELADNAWGIQLQYATGNEVIENEVTGSAFGIIVLQSTDNLIKENEFANNVRGIWLYQADDNEVIVNEVIDSTTVGIGVLSSSGNLIKKNEVLGSGQWDLFDSSLPLPLNNNWVENEYDTANWEP